MSSRILYYLLTTLAITCCCTQSIAPINDPIELSHKVQQIYANVTEAIKARPNESPVPFEYIKTSGRLVNQLAEYGDTKHFYKSIYGNVIAQAREEVLLTTFVFDRRGPTEDLILALRRLNDAAVKEKRIVRVYIIIDPIGSLVFPLMSKKGVQLPPAKSLFWMILGKKRASVNPTHYHFPEPAQLPGLDFSVKTYHHKIVGALHSKMIVIDGRMVIVGSKNFDGDVCMEYMATLRGPVALAHRKDFEAIWDTEPLPQLKTMKADRKKNVPMLVLGHTENGGRWKKSFGSPQNVAWLAALEMAQKSVFIQTPNFCDTSIRDKVVSILRKNPKLKVTIVSSWRSSDLLEKLFTTNYGNNWKTLNSVSELLSDDKHAQSRYRFCWYIGKRMGQNPQLKESEWSHVKAMIIDNEFAIVGSGNLDALSLYHSRENNVLIDDPQTARSIYKELLRPQQSLRACMQDP